MSVPVCAVPWWWYLVLHQHGDVHKHVMELLDAALQTHDVFVSRLNLIQSLLVDLGLCDLTWRRIEQSTHCDRNRAQSDRNRARSVIGIEHTV